MDRCELDLVNHKLKYWTKKGRVIRLKISPPATIDVFDDWDEWRMVVFYDFHQEEPEVCTVMDFVFTHEEIYLVHWYANWRKWPAI